MRSQTFANTYDQNSDFIHIKRKLQGPAIITLNEDECSSGYLIGNKRRVDKENCHISPLVIFILKVLETENQMSFRNLLKSMFYLHIM